MILLPRVRFVHSASACLSLRRTQLVLALCPWVARTPGVKTRPFNREAGFTLVEVIVALAMLSIGLGLVFGLVSNGLGRMSSASKMAEASSLAQSLLSETGTALPLSAAQRDGRSAHGYRWHVKIVPYGDIKGGPDAAPVLYQLVAEIEWDESEKKRSYVLTTLRLGPRLARS